MGIATQNQSKAPALGLLVALEGFPYSPQSSRRRTRPGLLEGALDLVAKMRTAYVGSGNRLMTAW